MQHFYIRISIHAPREGSDPQQGLQTGLSQISIHAPREGSDLAPAVCAAVPSHFYPRSPRGERPDTNDIHHEDHQFLSTLPARGATVLQHDGSAARKIISIHAPREGSDRPRLTT